MKFNWQDDFGALYKERGQQKFGIRLLAMWKLQSGESMNLVCSLLGKTQKTIREWRRIYEREGLESLLKIHPGRGRKERLQEKLSFENAIESLQDQLQGGRIQCQDIVDMVVEKYGVHYSRSGMYHVLHRLGFSWITSRSKHPQQDPKALEAFKKTL